MIEMYEVSGMLVGGNTVSASTTIDGKYYTFDFHADTLFKAGLNLSEPIRLIVETKFFGFKKNYKLENYTPPEITSEMVDEAKEWAKKHYTIKG